MRGDITTKLDSRLGRESKKLIPSDSTTRVPKPEGQNQKKPEENVANPLFKPSDRVRISGEAKQIVPVQPRPDSHEMRRPGRKCVLPGTKELVKQGTGRKQHLQALLQAFTPP